MEGRALARRDRYHLAALLRLDAGIGRRRRRVAVPGGRAGRAPTAQVVEEGLQLHVVCVDEALLPVDQDLHRAPRLATQGNAGRFGETGHAGFAHYLALDVVAVLAVDENFDVDADALRRL